MKPLLSLENYSPSDLRLSRFGLSLGSERQKAYQCHRLGRLDPTAFSGFVLKPSVV